MKKISVIINVIIIMVLIALLIILFGPMMMSRTVVSLSNNLINVNTPYSSDLTMYLKSKDENVMEDIYLENKYVVDNSLQEVNQNLNLSLGGEDFSWTNLFKFDTLQQKSPFDGRSIKFDNFNNYGIEKPNTQSLPFLYSFANEHIKNMNIQKKGFALSPYDSGNLLKNIRINYTYSSSDKEANKIFMEFLNEFENLPSYKSFFTENNSVEKALEMKDNVSGIKDMINLLETNSNIENIRFEYSISSKGIESIQMFANIDYNVNEKNIPMEFYVSQDYKVSSDINIDNLSHFSSITNIEELSPDTNLEDTYGKYSDTSTTVEDPVDGQGKIPGIILSDEYKLIARGH